jgi:NTE family protein
VGIETNGPTAPGGSRAARRRGIALCVSGGGFRATLFHLGAARRLHELGLLHRIDTMSSVSGGSIFAALLAELAVERGWQDGLAIQDFEVDVAERVRALTRRDMRTVPFLVHLPWNWLTPGLRARHMERRYRNRVSSRRLAELPSRPAFVFCATDMSFGINWEISMARSGSYQAGYLAQGSNWPVARAVAASACFPPIFGPLPVKASPDQFRGGAFRGDDLVRLRRKLALSDGGVYDNLGLEPVWKTHEHVLISDCGAPFEFRAGGTPMRRLLRYTSVVMNQAQALRKRIVFADLNRKPPPYRGAYWSIDTTPEHGTPGYTPTLIIERIAKIRTDLDSFTDAEQRILENHGYFSANRKLCKWVPELLPQPAPEAVAPHPEWMDEPAVRRALARSHRRVSLHRLIRHE